MVYVVTNQNLLNLLFNLTYVSKGVISYLGIKFSYNKTQHR